MRKHILAPLALALLATAVSAGDKEAGELLQKASAGWHTLAPEEVVKLLEQAEAAEPQDKFLRYQILLTKGQFLQVKIGDLEKAVAIYDKIIKGLVPLKEEETKLRELKSEAMANKANLIYSDKQDEVGALELYKAAVTNWTKSSICNMASQFCFRLARDTSRRNEQQRKEILDWGLDAASKAVEFAPAQWTDEAKRAPFVAKFKVQLAIMQQAAGKADEAKKTWDSIDKSKLGNDSLYQQAVWASMGGNPEEAAKLLKEFMAKTRPAGPAGVKSRNQLRKFIRGEPDFKAHAQHADWKDLVTDEPE